VQRAQRNERTRDGVCFEGDVEINEITGAIVEASIRIHRGLGPGVFESVYETLLASALNRRGMHVERQLPVSFTFDGIRFEQGFRIDLVVENSVIVEVKSLDRVAPIHRKQLLTYLRLTDLRVGLLLNFGADTMKEGITRVVNEF
jgi:iron complex transport system substrate-binding protein